MFSVTSLQMCVEFFHIIKYYLMLWMLLTSIVYCTYMHSFTFPSLCCWCLWLNNQFNYSVVWYDLLFEIFWKCVQVMVSLIGYDSFCAMILLSGNELNYNGNLSILNGAVLVAIFQFLWMAKKVGERKYKIPKFCTGRFVCVPICLQTFLLANVVNE